MRGFIFGIVVTILLIVVGGYLFVRSGGVSLATSFLLSASNWQSNEFPLQYEFGFDSGSGFQRLSVPSQASFVSAVLPQGSGSSN